MKKCPFCKADIDDHARFCLYCMMPLQEKEVIPPQKKKMRWWPLALAGALLAALLAVILLAGNKDSDLSPAPITETTGESHPATTVPETTEQTAPSQTPPETVPPSESEETPAPTAPPTEPEETAVETTPLETTLPPETVTETTHPTEEATEPEMPVSQAVYTYRTAQAGDDFSAQYQNPGTDIVITGISQPAADGVYEIPAYIDGQKVIAIAANAFSGSNATAVYVPATVKTIWNYAFAGCPLTDLYFRGNAVYTESKAFSNHITIHCSADCTDRNFHYYKDCASNYGAVWAEWKG